MLYVNLYNVVGTVVFLPLDDALKETWYWSLLPCQKKEFNAFPMFQSSSLVCRVKGK